MQIEPYKDNILPERFGRWIETLRLSLRSVPNFSSGTGSPEGVVTGTTKDQYTRTDGSTGTYQYVKTTATGNTGWIAIG